MKKMLIALTAAMMLTSNAFAAEEAGFGVGAVGTSTLVAGGLGVVVAAAAISAANNNNSTSSTSTVTATK